MDRIAWIDGRFDVGCEEEVKNGLGKMYVGGRIGEERSERMLVCVWFSVPT